MPSSVCACHVGVAYVMCSQMEGILHPRKPRTILRLDQYRFRRSTETQGHQVSGRTRAFSSSPVTDTLLREICTLAGELFGLLGQKAHCLDGLVPKLHRNYRTRQGRGYPGPECLSNTSFSRCPKELGRNLIRIVLSWLHTSKLVDNNKTSGSD